VTSKQENFLKIFGKKIIGFVLPRYEKDNIIIVLFLKKYGLHLWKIFVSQNFLKNDEGWKVGIEGCLIVFNSTNQFFIIFSIYYCWKKRCTIKQKL